MNIKTYIDQMQRTVEIPSTVLRIVSLVPSQTELLVDLGLENRLVGVTKFCIHPKGLKSRIAQIGGTKNIHIEKVRSLKPDLIIGNKEENEQSDILALEGIAPVWMSDIFDLQDALHMIRSIGEITETPKQAAVIAATIDSGMQQINNKYLDREAKVLYLIWKDPYMSAGKNTFIDCMIEHLGFTNIMKEARYPLPNLEELKPDYVWLSSEPYPFKEKHIAELKALFPESTVMLVDGEMFSWYGSRLIHSIGYFKNFLNEL